MSKVIGKEIAMHELSTMIIILIIMINNNFIIVHIHY